MKLLKNDEYNFDTNNITEANATKTYLWELNLLNNHYISKVSSLVSMFKQNMKTELDLNQYLGKTMTEIFEDEISRKAKIGTPLEYNEPKTLISTDEYPLWEL